jgi:hypothetical protein
MKSIVYLKKIQHFTKGNAAKIYKRKGASTPDRNPIFRVKHHSSTG